MSNQSARITERREALKKEIGRTETLEKFDRLTGEIADTLTELGVSTTERNRALEPLWNFLKAQLARKPYIPGVQYIREASEGKQP